MTRFKNVQLAILLSLLCSNLFGANRYWVANSSENWNDTNNWSTSSGGAGGASIPITGDFVFFNANGLGNCLIDITVAIDGLNTTGYSGTIDLNGFAFNPTSGGSANITFNHLSLIDSQNSTQLSYTTTGQTDFNGGTFNVNINIISGRIDFDGGTYNNPVEVEDNGGSSTDGSGGCIFNSTLKVLNSGTSYFLMGQTNPDIFNDDVTLLNTSTSRIRIAYGASGTQFNGNLILGSTNGSGIWFGETVGSSSLASNKTISVHPSGFTTGELRLKNLVQTGSTNQSFSLSNVATLRFQTGTIINGDLNIDAPRFYLDGATFNGTVDFEKTGASNDASIGGNTFADVAILTNSGSGYFMLGNASPDIFQSNLTVNNIGTNTCYIGNNSSGNAISGNLVLNNTGTGTSTNIYVSNGNSASLSIVGNCTIINAPLATNGSILLGENGDINIGGNLEATNSPTSSNGYIRIANRSNSSVVINGTTTLENNGNQSTSRIYFGAQGDIQQDGLLTIRNNSTATNSQIYCNNSVSSINNYNESIIVESTDTQSDGIRFGSGNGSATLAAGKTISIGPNGYVGGVLELRNFDASGLANQFLTCTGEALIILRDCIFGANIDFHAPRITISNTNVSGTTIIEKTGGIGNDLSYGGNKFIGNLTVINSGSNYLAMAYQNPDSCMANVVCTNSGTHSTYLFYNTTDNFIGGNLTANNLASGTSSSLYVGYTGNGSFNILGNCTISNNASSTSSTVSLGNSADFSVNGNLLAINNGSGTTANFYMGGQGTFSITGKSTLSNIGSGYNTSYYVSNNALTSGVFNDSVLVMNSGNQNTNQMYIGNTGDLIFNKPVSIKNTSSANNARIYLNNSVGANTIYNDNIFVESTHINTNGIYFGNSNGTGILANNKTINIGSSGYIAGDLLFRNFTQLSNTAQNLTTTGTANLTIYDCNWNGDITFTSPRLTTRGSTYSEITFLEKTGATNDGSLGGNTFLKNCELKNTGTGYFLMGNGSADVWGGNLITNNLGTHNLYIAYNSPGNTIAGNLNATHATSGGINSYTHICSAAASTLSISGNCNLNMSGNSTNNYMNIAESGSVNITGDLTYQNIGTGTTAELRAAFNTGSNIVINGNTLLNNSPTSNSGNGYLAYNGSALLHGNLTLNHEPMGNNGTFSIANGINSSITINGDTKLTNLPTGGNTKQINFGNQGDVICNGALTISNQANSNNNHIYCNNGVNSTAVYTDHIVLENTHADGDGISFGNSGGQATLNATKTVTIGGGGFIAGELTFRNFNQIGTTAQTILATGTAILRNTGSDWGGNINFRSPRLYSAGTRYRGSSFLEKTGSSSDGSTGGNIFDKNCELKNSGSGYLLFGNINPDVWTENLFLNNVGTHQMYIAYNSIGNSVNGNFEISNASTGASASTHIHASTYTNSTLTINGTTTVNNLSSSSSHYIYLGESGSINFLDNVLITQNGTGNNGTIQIASNASSTVNITGNLNINNIGAENNSNITIANNGTFNINGDFISNHSPTGLNGYFNLASGTPSTLTVNGNTSITSGTTGGNLRIVYVGNNGTTNFNGTLSLLNQSDASSSVFYCNNGANAHGNYNDTIFIESSNPVCDGISFGNSNGAGILAAGKTINITSGGFIAGRLYFRNFTQNGTTPQSLNLTGTSLLSNYLSDWGGMVNFVSPRINTYLTRYRGLTYLEKTGSLNDASAGGNRFDENVELRNTGSGYFMMGNGYPDTLNKNLLINNLGTYNMYFAHNSAGNIITGDLTINNSGSGTNLNTYISNSTSSTLAIGGNVLLNNNGTATNVNTNFGGNGDITIQGKTTVNNNANTTNNQIYIANGSTSLVIFEDTVTVTNTNTSGGTAQRAYIGSSGSCIFNDFLKITNSSSASNSQIYCNNYTSSTNKYNSNVEINNVGSSTDGIYFGSSGGIGELASGQTINIGSGGFSNGTLYFRNFNQFGGTPQTLLLTGPTRLENYASTWNGNIDFRAADQYTRLTTYNGTVYLEKNGANSNPSTGGNIFNQPAILQNNGTGYFMPANGTGNDFNSDVTFNQTNTGIIRPCYNSISTFAGNIYLNIPGAITFGSGGNGRAELDGTTAQSINSTGLAPIVNFRDLQTNNSLNNITLNTPIVILYELDLDQGNINSDSINTIYMNDNSIVSSVSDNAYVNGPIIKEGNESFTFPTGKSGFYRPIEITAPSSSSAEFKAEYFMEDPNPTYDHGSADPSIQHISSCEYWILDRLNSTNSVNVSLSWNNNTSCGVDQLSELVVARWDGATWKNEGNGGTTGNTTNGTILTGNSISSFSPFTLASITINNPLPIELLNFDATKQDLTTYITWETASEFNNDYFEVLRSNNGVDFFKIGRVQGSENSNQKINYQFIDLTPQMGLNYYRLKQVDFDGLYSFSRIKTVDFNANLNHNIFIYPNPVIQTQNSVLKNNSELEILQIDIYNDYGALIQTQLLDDFTNQTELKTASLSAGMYTIIIRTSHTTISRKLVILN